MAQRILAVDDDEAILRLVSLTLKREGFDVMTTSEPQNVTPACLVYRPDLILCDVMMPYVDGFEVLRRLQEHPLTSNLPVVFLSAGRGEEVKTRAFRSGVVDYITKPFTSQSLVLKLKRAMLGVSRGTGSISRDLEETPTEEFLNRLTEGLRTGVMSIRTDSDEGAVILKAGEILACNFGDLAGEQALAQMYQQRGGELHFREADGTKVALYDGRVDETHDGEITGRLPAGRLGSPDDGAPPRRLLLFGHGGPVQDSLKEVLELDGFEVFTSQIPAVGIEFAKRALPDIIVSDVLSPGVTGVAFCEAVRDESTLADVPILMLAAADYRPLIDAAGEAAVSLRAGEGLGDRLDPVNVLRARIHLLLERRARVEEDDGERPVGLSGELAYVGLGEIATLMETGEKSGWLMVAAGSHTGAFYFARGYLVHAELDEEIAAEPGAALESAREWNAGSFEFFPD